MDFKNKLGTVDAHNLNLNFKPDNTDSHNIILNFEHLADGSTNLNFGDDVAAVIDTVLETEFSFEVTAIYADSSTNTAVIDTVLDTELSFDVVAVFSENTHVVGQIETVLDTRFSFEINAEFAENLCTIDTVLDTGFKTEIAAIFDINFIRGIEVYLIAGYQGALPCLSVIEIPWAKPVLRAHHSAFYFEHSLGLSNQALLGFEKAALLYRSVQLQHEQATGLSSDTYFIWQENKRLAKARTLVFEEGNKLRINRITDWEELVRKRRNFTYSHQVAHVFEKCFAFEWDKGLELITTSSIAWDKAKAIHYRKHPVQPWPQPELPEYVGRTDLNFTCLCSESDPHNLILNFGADDCIPALPNRNWWYIVNELSVSRLDNGQNIQVYDGSYSTDRSRWCWSYSLSVPASEIPKLEPVNGQPVILRVMVNGTEHHMLLENRSRSRRFAETTYTLNGRSQSALLDAPYAPTRSFTQENERTARQLCQAELDRVNSSTTLQWGLIDELSWIVPAGSLSYSNMTPIAVIKMIAESAGGFVYSEKGSDTITIKPKYKKTFWDSITVEEYDRLIPESLVTEQSTDYEPYPDYNGITLTNDRSGLSGQIKRTGTAGDTLLETANNPLFTVESMGSYGKAVLAKSGLVETHNLVMPIGPDVSECVPGDLVAFNAEWWGIIEGVNVSFNHAVINQSIKVESINRE
ncbi:hypothetical protein F939_02257 [Acinetobacter radioresistens DSM 6976 = NBRC 102413 = CIP 103788]|uniref:hypothetical protein n=1 Tax=Acinetobacter radioresistens TaxID=40216 RepID=UPI00028C7414|nr:hypothetical protein [Acinetobacter radioresistens]ENV87473.1 hypothetical protein F939_02257 [Acinetobacter radioresistens DSM 6976 = NBRC 102413 = CIP 103788]BBL21104.1 hypothetical protein ACRAD_17750 [Acinetobacter radioresistens DSM 6976 = NBRC 102413 = CIP 103788]